MVIAEEKVELRKYFKRLRSQLTAEQAASGSLLTAVRYWPVMHIAKRTASWAIWLSEMSCL